MDENLLHYKMWQQQQGRPSSNLNFLAYGKNPDQLKQAQEPQGGSGLAGILKRNLNIEGQVGGGLAGAAAGTAIAPGVGTVIGGLLGAFGGGFGGEAAKRATLGEDQNLKESLIQGGIGAANEAGGQVIGQIGGRVLGKLLGKGAEEGAEIGVRALGKSAESGGENALTKTGNRLLTGQYGLGSREARAFQAGDTVKNLANLGLTKPEDIARIAPEVTGSNGVLSKVVRNAVGKAGGVETDGVSELARSLADNPLLAQNALGEKFSKFIDKGLIDIYGGSEGSLATKANPSNTFGFIKDLEGKAADLVGKGRSSLSVTAENKALANAYRQVANELSDRLFTGAGADQAVAHGLVTPEVQQQLLGLAPKNKAWAKFVQGDIANAQTVGELRSLQAPFVKGGQLVKASEEAASNMIPNSLGKVATPLRIGTMLGGLAGAGATGGLSIPIAAAGEALTTQTGKRIAGNALRSLGGAAGSGTVSSTLGRLTGVVAPVAERLAPRAIESTASPSPVQANQFKDLSDVEAQDFGNPENQATQPGAVGGLDINSMVQQALSNPDANAQKQQLALISQLVDIQNSANPAQKQSAAEEKTVNDIQDASSILDTIDQQFGDLGGAEGPLGGAADIPLVGQYINPKGSAYNQTKVDAATALAKALTGSARPAASVIAQYAKSLPQLTDNPQVAAQKLANVRKQLENKLGNYQ